MYEIFCPFCKTLCVSDVISSREEVNGQYECPNGHQFVVIWVDSVAESEHRLKFIEANLRAEAWKEVEG